MEVTKQMIKERFNLYNKLYFGGKLGKCKFYLLPKNTTLCGRFVSGKDSKGNEFGRIWIGNNVDWKEEELRETIVHEMIHMYNEMVQRIPWPLTGLFRHGLFFFLQCLRIYRKYDIKVTKFAYNELRNKKLEPSKTIRVIKNILDWRYLFPILDKIYRRDR
ncbi:MAG: SprT-like domain-containing protein [Bacteroidales bacterium]|nr:SprT-like domain-containing protein [Candidatus Colimorpha onthohippi]